MWKCKMYTIVLIGNKASIFICSDVKYHTISNSGHDTVIINTEQPF